MQFYNPTQCGMVRVKNDNDATTSAANYYLNHVYHPDHGDLSINEWAGQVYTVIPMNGAKWFSGMTL